MRVPSVDDDCRGSYDVWRDWVDVYRLDGLVWGRLTMLGWAVECGSIVMG